MLYDVHLYVTCRVKVWNVEAESQKAAVEKAYDELSGMAMRDMPQLDDASSSHRPQRADDTYPMEAEWCGYCEEVTGALVDEFGDEEHERSTHYEYPQCGTWQEMVAALREVQEIIEGTYAHDEKTGERLDEAGHLSGADVVEMLSNMELKITDVLSKATEMEGSPV